MNPSSAVRKLLTAHVLSTIMQIQLSETLMILKADSDSLSLLQEYKC